jgi:cytochrome b subunit of formate dehydrogenase/nitrate/TMAO reductase-like tetraheme cytochrome c subunit
MRTLFSACFLSLFLAASAFAQLANDDCLACHDTVDPQKFAGSVHASLECSNCHASITAVPHETIAPVDCAACHEEPVAKYTASVHGKAHAKGDKVAATCIDCHGKHDILPKSDPKSKTNRFNVPKTCASCHANSAVTGTHTKTHDPLPSPEVIQKYFDGVHGRATTEKGLNVAPVCSDCHNAHDVLPRSNSASAVSHANVPTTCGKCHEGILNQFRESAHGQAWAKNNASGPVCSSCHEAHGIRQTASAGFRSGMVAQCSNCHAVEAPTYRDSFHGQATKLGYISAAQCSDCHTPHLNLPKSDPRSSVHKANVVKTCAKCHPDATPNFASFQPHADPHNEKTSPQVYYVYNYLMKWLLIGTFAFFGIHMLLWLQRSVVMAIRGELPKHESASGIWVRRFDRKHRLTHIAVIVSFLALAATGLPLMYSDHSWGKTLAELFGGVGVSSVIHRIFAVVTLGYALYHLAFLLRKLFVRRDWSAFVGPDSLMPRMRDLIDLKNMVKWFLYLGPRPRFDRFTYWEKFDYFAVFWGVPVIGLSGLMLWIPTIVTRVLPGWMLNVAMLIHGDEALLAIGFIFTFHFFHTHLRPEAFPLDPVMFTGRMSLERFKDERPDEYERMVVSGRLEEMLTTPPTEQQLAFTRWFGYTALAIGVVLIVAIYGTLLAQFTR